MGCEISTIIRPLFYCISLYQKIKEVNSKKLNDRKPNNITPMSIATRIKDTPKTERKQIEKSFKGIKINWHVKFEGIKDRNWFTRKIFTDIVNMKYGNNEQYGVNVYLLLNDFPDLKIAEKDTPFIVTGTITRVKGTSIYIKTIAIKKDEFFVI